MTTDNVAQAAAPVTLADGRVTLHGADCRDVLRGIPDNSIDSIATDPPYALVSITKRFGKPGSKPAKDVYGRGAAGFMGKTWDTGEVAFSEEFWAECLRFLKPGGTLVSILPATAHYDHGELEGEWRDLPVGSFAEAGTNVPTGMLRMRVAANDNSFRRATRE